MLTFYKALNQFRFLQIRDYFGHPTGRKVEKFSGVNPDTNQLISSDGNDSELEPNDETAISQEDRWQLINELTGNLMLRWEKFAAIQSMKKVRDFASDINDLALKYNYRPLKEMAHKLSQAVDSFDIIEMNQTLKKYPDLVLKMQNNDSNAWLGCYLNQSNYKSYGVKTIQRNTSNRFPTYGNELFKCNLS